MRHNQKIMYDKNELWNILRNAIDCRAYNYDRPTDVTWKYIHTLTIFAVMIRDINVSRTLFYTDLIIFVGSVPKFAF